MIGTKLARYEITSHLGQAVWAKCIRPPTLSSVAVWRSNFFPNAFTHDTERAARFQREARVQASLNHPNIAAIPGTTYAFQVRSLSKAGFSNWTDLTARFSPRMDNTHT
jgi:hypothetical protein